MVGNHLHSQQADRSKLQLIMKRRSKCPQQSHHSASNGNWQYVHGCRNAKGSTRGGSDRFHWVRGHYSSPVRA
jgi:hypothetical protein